MFLAAALGAQPPSGGCVLKQAVPEICGRAAVPAAFGRLCVETLYRSMPYPEPRPAAFRRLCVETVKNRSPIRFDRPAAFRRLRVETLSATSLHQNSPQPPSGGCVLKLIIPPLAICATSSRLRATVYQNNSEISYNKGRLKT